MWHSTKERTKLGKINRTGIGGKSLQKSNETDALKGEKCLYVCVCVCAHKSIEVFRCTVCVCVSESVCVCMHIVWVQVCTCVHAFVCMDFCGCVCVCIEGSVNSPGCVGAVFSVLLSVATAK